MKIYLTQDTTIKLKLAGLVKLLNNTCTSVQFKQLKLSYQAPDQLINCPATHAKYLKKIKAPEDGYILLLTDRQYDNNYFYEEEKGLIIVSFFAWQYLTSLPRENGLVYFICGILMDIVMPWDSVEHTERLGCVNDFLADKTRVDDGMRKGLICPVCKSWLQKNSPDEDVTKIYTDVMSVLQLLSAASGRDMNILEPPVAPETAGAELESFHDTAPAADAEPVAPVRAKPAIGMGTTVFISYSHKDEKYRINLEDHLKILQRLGMISTWTDRMINPGEEWKTAIDDNLNKSGIILLLISASFIASDYCYGIELKTALERDERDEAIAIPVILRDCLWQIGPFAKLQALPKDGKPIQKFTRKDEAYTSIAREICRLIQGT